MLTVEADYHRVTGSVGLDNTLADDLGTWTLATGVEVNSAFNLGETIYFRASGYPGGDGEDGFGGLHRLSAHAHVRGRRGLPDRNQRAHLQRGGHR